MKLYVIQLGIERNAYLKEHTSVSLEIRHEDLDQIAQYLEHITHINDPTDQNDTNPTLAEALDNLRTNKRTVYRGDCGAANTRIEWEGWTIITHTLDEFKEIYLEFEGIHKPEIQGLDDSKDGICDG